MNKIKLFLLAFCLTFSFGDAFAGDINVHPSPIRIKRNEVKLETHVLQLNSNEYAVVFGDSYDDVTIEIYDNEGCLIGCVEADYVTVHETVVVTTYEDGAVELTVFSDDEVVFSTEL